MTLDQAFVDIKNYTASVAENFKQWDLSPTA